MEQKINLWMIVAIVALVLLLFNGSGIMGFGGFGCGSYSSGYSGGMMSWMFGNPIGMIFGFLGMLIGLGVAIIIFIYFIKMITNSLNQPNNLNNKRNKK